MTLQEYQHLANRTCNKELKWDELQRHALFEMCGELGEIQSIFQKAYQGHVIDDYHLMEEVGDLLWGIAEFCLARGWDMNDIANMNITKLRKRYPNGFEAERSVNREAYE